MSKPALSGDFFQVSPSGVEGSTSSGRETVSERRGEDPDGSGFRVDAQETQGPGIA